jgi:hypothetical protein
VVALPSQAKFLLSLGLYLMYVFCFLLMKHMLRHVLKKSFPLSRLKKIRVVATWAARYHQIGPGWSAIEFFFKNDTFTNQIYKKGVHF